jgi:hypothetical protein
LAANGSGGFTTATLNKVGTPTANFAMGGFTLTGLPTPTTSDQVAIKGYVDTAISGVSVTAGTGLTKTGNTLAVSLTAGTAISISGATIGVSPASIGLAQLSATGITSSTTYHRGDNTWADFATAVGAAVNFTGGTGITISGSTISVTNSSIGPTQLSATGTASASTFFRGDNTWAPISTLLSSTSLSSLSAPTAAVPWGGKGLTNLANPVNAQDAATKAYVDSATHPACRVATRGSETYTITSNSVTQISGTTIDGVSPSIGDRVLIKDAPATSGGGSILSSQPTNGVYVVTANTTNLTVARATDMSSATPAGAMIIVEAGSINAQTCWLVSSPSSAASFTYGTTAMQWTPFVNVGSGLTRSGNILSLNSTLTGVTMAYGANTITGLPYDLSFVGFGASTSRATGTGDNPMGIRLQRAATLTSVTFRCASADVSGNLVVQLDRNGSAISGTSTTIAAANQVAGVTTTFSHACSAGDIITAQITAIGTTPGSGLVVDITGSY